MDLTLGLPGFEYPDLFDAHRLALLLDEFDTFLHARDPALQARYLAWRSAPDRLEGPEAESALLTETAPHVGAFVAKLFDISAVHSAVQDAVVAQFDTLFACKKSVVAKLKTFAKKNDLPAFGPVLETEALHSLVAVVAPDHDPTNDLELALAAAMLRLDAAVHAVQNAEEAVSSGAQTKDAGTVTPAAQHPQGFGEAQTSDAAALATRLTESTLLAERFAEVAGQGTAAVVEQALNLLRCWCIDAIANPSTHPRTRDWVLFKEPARTDFNDLVPHETIAREGYETWEGPRNHRRRRDGFGLTDPRFPERRVLYEVDHCIYCHERDTDSCSKGMRNKRGEGFKQNPLGVTVTGCPLGEKISEMHLVKRGGDNIGALALVMIDNPMCPGTGHRICNDCMKGCIYQKTEPVNIPQIETNVLTDVLDMPWGFEIYGLLTRFNPLNVKRPHMLPYNGKNALVVGLGPAGYTLSHYLMNEGFGVVGIDALKIEPLPEELVGAPGKPPRPIRDYSEIREKLDERVVLGFGGVAEYGITVRWDKNFLKVIYLTLARRLQTFRIYGGVRFGGTLTLDDAWRLGFHHVAIAAGAGQPTVIDIKNNLCRGIRKASDFLMGLQLSGAAKRSSLANLQVRLPAGVIGGGLTAVDTTTEVMAYYPIQVEKTLDRYESLVGQYGETHVRTRFDAEEIEILDEFVEHGRAVRAERARAAACGAAPDFAPLIAQWGGVTLYYRKGMADSPAYRQNHEEIREAFEESIAFAEGMSPLEAIEDQYGALRAVRFDKLTQADGRWQSVGHEVEVPLKSLFVAAGTAPNTIYEQEFPGTFEMDGKFFQRFEMQDNEPVARDDETTVKIGHPAPLTSYANADRRVSFYGDNHPVYAGNVVKAMASAKDGYPHVVALFAQELATLDPAQQPARDAALQSLFETLDDQLVARVVEVKRLTPTIIDVIVRAPLAAEKFEPGQFYRVQNLESRAPMLEGTTLAAEGLALTGAWVDKSKGLISLIALEMGSSSRLCQLWEPGEEVVVMGVTGTPTEIPAQQTVMLVGGGLGNAVQFSIGKALRAAGSRVIYFAGYKKPGDVFKQEDIEAAADTVVWAVDPGPGVEAITPRRPQDKTWVGNILETIVAYAKGEMGENDISLEEVDRMIVIGSDRMMSAVKDARYGVLAPYLPKKPVAIGSINSPMQCMMKGICAQCLCKHVDPDTGEETFVYSCYNQDQELDRVDFAHLNARLRQNSVQEKLSDMWLDHLFSIREAAA